VAGASRFQQQDPMRPEHASTIRAYAEAKVQAMLLLDLEGWDADPETWPPAWWRRISLSESEALGWQVIHMLRERGLFDCIEDWVEE